MSGSNFLWLAPVGSLMALAFAWYLASSILKKDEGNEKMREIAQAVRVGGCRRYRWRPF